MKITGYTLNLETRQVHVYHTEEVTLPSGRVIVDNTSTVFDEDLEFDNQQNWGNEYIEMKVAEKLKYERSVVNSAERKVPPEIPQETPVEVAEEAKPLS